MSSALPLLQFCDSDAPIAWWRGAPVTRRDYLAHVAHFVRGLPQTRYVVNLCEDRYLFLIGFAAAIMSGKTNLLPPSRARLEARNITAYADGFTITDVEVEAALSEIPAAGGALEFADQEAPRIAADHAAVVVFTSGSTGHSRAHVKRWGNLVRGAHCAERRFGFRRRGVAIVATVPAQHMYGLETSIMAPLACGVSVYGARPFYAADIHAALAALPAPRALVTTPLHLRVCAESGLDWPAIEFIISATAPLPLTLAQTAERVLKAPVLEIYGSTETGSIASRRRLDGDLWQTYDGVSVAERQGGFYAHGAHLREPVALNDTLAVRDATHFELAGRPADMVNIAGKRASLGDLTLKVADIQGVEDVVFLAPDEDADLSARLLALVVAPELAEAEILARLVERVDPAFIPRPLYKVDRLPRDELGKLPRAELLALVRRMRHRARCARKRSRGAGERIQMDFETAISADHPSLPGHFPETPIVPGVVILDEVVAAVARWRGDGRIVGFPIVKFLLPLRAGQPFTIHLAARKDSAHHVEFHCRIEWQTIAVGRLEVRSIAPTWPTPA